ncbi:MAG: dienelactone hydrolase [Peptococcaceae bacterium BRH_c4a]|nr:MAG: dienelactone hydrolase [Peptococcaceae bacterium BRH_c4a]
MDKIIMKGMRFYGHHGVLPHERELGQIFEVDLELSLDLGPAGHMDDLSLTVSYADVFGLAEELVTGSPMNLIEAVAQRIADGVLEKFTPVRAVRVVLKKPSAPVQGVFDYMAAEITRVRDRR